MSKSKKQVKDELLGAYLSGGNIWPERDVKKELDRKDRKEKSREFEKKLEKINRKYFGPNRRRNK